MFMTVWHLTDYTGGEGRAYAEYAEELHAVGHGLASPDEYAYELMGKAEVDCGAKPGQACGYGSGGEHRGAHTLVVACRVVVGYQGKHSLGHAAHPQDERNIEHAVLKKTSFL